MAKNAKLLAALLLGAAAGAAIGVLFAPEKGAETRKKLAGKASEMGDEFKKRWSKGKESVDEYKERVMNKADEMKNAHTRANQS
jgi:gas vesicle protein